MATRENLIDLEVSLRAEGADKAADEVSAALKEIASAQTRLANVEAQANEARARNNLQLATTLDQAITQQREAIQELINQAAQAASAQAGSGPDPEETDKKAGALAALGQAFGELKDKLGPIGSLIDGFSSALENIESPQQAVIAVSTALIGALVGVTAALAQAGQKAGDYIKAQEDLKKTIGGGSNSFLAALTLGIERAGGSTADLADALLQLGDRAKQATEEGSEAAKAFTDLGINAVDATGKLRSIEDIFTDIDTAAKNGAISQEQLISLASILGDEASRQLLPLIGQFGELKEKVSDLGRSFEDEAIEATKAYKSNAQDLKQTLEGIGLQIGADVLPAFQSLTKATLVAVDVLRKDASFTKGLDALLDLLVDIVSTVGPAVINIVLTFSRVAVGGFNLVNNTARLVIEKINAGLELIQSRFQPILDLLGLTGEGFKEFDKALSESLKPEVLEAKFGILGQAFSFLLKSQNEFLAGLKGKGETEKATKDTEEISRKIKDLGEQLKEVEKSYPKLTESAQDFSEAQKNALRKAFAEGKLNKEDFDQAITKSEQELNSKLVELALDRVNKIKAIRRKGLLNQTADSIEEAEKELNKKILEKEKSFAEAAAKEREDELKLSFDRQNKEFENFIQQIENEESRLTDQIKTELDKREINNVTAAKRTLLVAKDAIIKQISQLNTLLESDQITSEQRLEFEAKLQNAKTRLQKLQNSESRVLREAQIKDIEDGIKKISSIIAASNSRRDTEIQNLTSRLVEQGFTETEIAERVSKAKKEALDTEIGLRRTQLELARQDPKLAEEATQIETELLKKKQERLLLEIQIKKASSLGSAGVTANQALQAEIKSLEAGSKFLQDSLRVTAGLLNGIIQDFGKGREARFQVVDENNLEAAIKDFQLLQQQIEAVKREALEKGSLLEGGFLNAAIELGNETLEALRKKIGSAQIEIARKVAEESARQRLEVAEETVKKLVEAEKELEEQLEDLRKQKKAANKRAAQQRAEAEKEADEDIARAEKELEERRKENRESFLKAQLDLSKKFREEDLRNAVQTAEAAEDARLSARERGLKAAQAAERELTKVAKTENEKRAELQNLSNDHKASKDQIDKARKDLEEAIKQRAALEKEQADKRAKEAKRQEAIEGAIKEGGSKEEIDARIEAINAQFEAEQQFQEDLSEAVKSGNQERIENTKKLFEEEQALIRQKLQIELDRLAKEKEAREKERQAERDRLKADFDQKNLELQAQFEKEKVQRQQALDQQLADIKSALDKELMEVKKQKDKLVQEQQRYFNNLAQELGLSSGAFEQYYKAIIEGALNTQKAINDIASELSKLPDSSNSANNSTTSSSTSSFFGGAGRVSVSSLSQQPKADDSEDASPTSPKKNFEKEKIRGKAKKSKDRDEVRSVDLAEDGLGKLEEESIETNRSEIAVNVPVSLPKIEIKIQSNNIDSAQLEKTLAALVTKDAGLFSQALKEKIRQSIVRIGEFQNRQAGIF